MKYLRRLKNKKAAPQGTAKAAKTTFDSKDSTRERRISKNQSLKELLSQVGAKVIEEDTCYVLRFNPHLAGPWHDAERWELAGELEKLFFELYPGDSVSRE